MTQAGPGPEPAPEPRLTVTGLRHRYADRPVIEDLTFTVPAGRAVALVGPNGAGKTTVLRCIVGSAEPAAGRILLDGVPIDERAELVRRDVAALLDDLDFFPDLTAAEHLDLLARAHGNATPEDLVDTLLDDVGLLAAADQLPGSLSSGQRRRLALATALVRPRTLLVLDEPEQRLDTSGVAWLAERLQEEKEAGTSVVFASHDPALVEAVADDTVELTPLP
ncbi:heme exporter protein CcmA [Kribbella flavida DSM 17836]|uniref:Heme exporter protein CcmA n=1 Tax=Kribbella flavida (strain DSM 17836 / JCM 10339 / NBRC 14399) TaxID=479435 RepID=D2PXT0_KRIFD|nr:ABC transporter ATP-binding protein [Kribbella flavida]ADB31722.1 heme exporter protein CcmA [Kribbella flavida DSM 17836]